MSKKAEPKFLYVVREKHGSLKYVVAKNSGEVLKKWNKCMKRLLGPLHCEEEDTPEEIEMKASEEDVTLIL